MGGGVQRVPDEQPQVVAAPAAALGSTDVTRRWAVRCGDGRDRWPGLTRTEADAAVRAAAGSQRWDELLIRVELGVVLSDGAGPYLLDADGTLILVVAAHPAFASRGVAMGQAGPQLVRIGVVAPATSGRHWIWCARSDVPVARRVAALDALDRAGTDAEVAEWEAYWRAVPGGPPMP